MNPKMLEKLDEAINLICDEMGGRRTETVIALAEVLRDLVVARAILSKIKQMC